MDSLPSSGAQRADLRALGAAQLFAGADEPTLAAALASATHVNLAEGQHLLQPGEENDRLFILADGRLGIFLNESSESAVARLQPGDCVGEQSVIDEGRASAYVRALAPSRLFAFTAAQLWQLMDAQPRLALNLVRILSDRVRRSNRTLLENLKEQVEYRLSERIDSLTGLHNRRWMEESFPRQIERCQRNGKPVSLIALTIDRFKSIGPRHGLLAVDAVLAGLADTIERRCRPGDLLVRHGNDSFCLLAPEADTEEALHLAARLGHTVAATPCAIGDDKSIAVTLSLGVVQHARGNSFSDLVAAAFAAAASAHEQGGNRAAAAR